MHKNQNYFLKLVMVCFGLLSLQSCFVAKDFVSPELNVAETFGDYKAIDSSSIAAISWKEFFTDDQLLELIQTALDSNYDAKIAYQNILAAESFYRRGKARYFPSINGNVNVSSTDFSENSVLGQQFANNAQQNQQEPPSRVEQFDLTVSTSWEADIWGRITSIKNAELSAVFEVEAAYRALQTRIVADVATLYYQLQTLDAQLAVAEETVKTREKSLATITTLKESGQTTAVAIKQQEAQLYTAKIVAADTRKQLRLVENSLSLLLAQSPTSIERSALEPQRRNPEIDLGYPAQLLRNRPDVLQAEYQLKKAFYNTNAAEAEFYPRITLGADVGFQSLAFKDWFQSGSFYNTLLGGLAQPIFNRRQIKTRYEVQQTEQEKALYGFKKQVLLAEREVSDALVAYRIEQEKELLRKKQLAALRDAVQFSNTLLTNGYANYLEVLRATDQMLNTELQLIGTYFEIRQSEVALYQALGGGWTTD